MIAISVQIDCGTSIKAAAREMIHVANQLNATVWSMFNEYHIFACPEDLPADVVARYEADCKARAARREENEDEGMIDPWGSST